MSEEYYRTLKVSLMKPHSWASPKSQSSLNFLEGWSIGSLHWKLGPVYQLSLHEVHIVLFIIINHQNNLSTCMFLGLLNVDKPHSFGALWGGDLMSSAGHSSFLCPSDSDFFLPCCLSPSATRRSSSLMAADAWVVKWILTIYPKFLGPLLFKEKYALPAERKYKS